MQPDVGNRYFELCSDVAAHAMRCGRDPASIGIVAVTKKQPISLIQQLHTAGCCVMGENRVQEAMPKITDLPSAIQWHLIGSLQKNKVAKVIGNFQLIHSVDSVELAVKISQASIEAGVVTHILLQVNTSGESTKHGFIAADVAAALDVLLPLQGIQIDGFMTMAPAEAPTMAIATCFCRLRMLRDTCASRYGRSFPILSMGMSHDYPIAIAEGATLLRIGSALFS
jgi:pyridoxal phosphate enzyme (YggS family)